MKNIRSVGVQNESYSGVSDIQWNSRRKKSTSSATTLRGEIPRGCPGHFNTAGSKLSFTRTIASAKS